MNRVIVTLTEGDLREAELVAKELHVSRAEVFRRALAAFSEKVRHERQEEEVRREREDAVRELGRLRSKFGADSKWNPVGVIRAWRDRETTPPARETRGKA